MSDANKAIARRFYDAINAGNLNVIDELVSPDFIEHEEFPGLSSGRDGVKQFFGMVRTAFPDFRITAEAMFADGDIVVTRATMTGTHKGEFAGMAPKGASMRVAFADFLRFADGRCVEHWGVTDTGAMMQQLGGG